MRSDLTDITVVLDRSGSMATCREEAENGLNAFIDKQKAEPGEAAFTLVQFDNEYEAVHSAVPIKDVPKFTLVTRGMTALLDALGRAINETGARLSAIAEAERPGLVVFVILTDGQENASHEFKRPQVREMLERQERDYQWKFIYLGANQDAFAEAGGLGISTAAAANYNTNHIAMAFGGVGASKVSCMRAAAATGAQVTMDCYEFTDEERESLA